MKVARGLFRLWLILSVLWIGGVVLLMWTEFPDDSAIWFRQASVFALLPLPPAFVLVLGSALVWAFRGFRVR
jgi:hypothetical protein